jgi:hypothetical protein
MVLLFLLLALNVKLVVKVVAILFIIIANYKSISWKNVRQQSLVLFYITIVGIGLINYFLQWGQGGINYTVTATLGISLWIMSAIASFFLYTIIQKEDTAKIHRAIELFFILHIAAIGFNLLLIIIETGVLNPYTYKGLHQKYYISTGDFIRGITFDSPVCTAMISAFAVLYFLYRQRLILSILAFGSLMLIGSNLTNIFLLIILVFAFIYRTNRLQKSVIAVYIALFIFFVSKISPQNHEYMGRFAYKMMGKPYDLPFKNTSPDFIKTRPDSLLNNEERRVKIAKLYIDSISTTQAYLRNRSTYLGKNNLNAFYALLRFSDLKPTKPEERKFFEYNPEPVVINKIQRFQEFYNNEYAADSATLTEGYNWSHPGKWIAAMQLLSFLKEHPSKILLGEGVANFSSRTAFKASGLDIAGSYPSEYEYISPYFHDNHLFLYIYYHSQQQPKHAAENTPDSTYYQLLGEYGIAGAFAFAFLYLGFFVKRIRNMSYGLPLLLLLLMAFTVEYWFEQLSIVILAEALLFIDMKKEVIK